MKWKIVTARTTKINRTATTPRDAAAGFRELAHRHRALDPSLVWEAEGHLGGVHYDALLRLPGTGTVSLALAPDRALPWALRHAHHARESDLLRVNGLTLNMQTVMGYLDGLWHDARLLESLIDGCLVRQAVDARLQRGRATRWNARAVRHVVGAAVRLDRLALGFAWRLRIDWRRQCDAERQCRPQNTSRHVDHLK